VRSEKLVGEGESSSGDDEDSDSDSDPGPGLARSFGEVVGNRSIFVDRRADSYCCDANDYPAKEAADLVVVSDIKLDLPQVRVVEARSFLISGGRQPLVVNISPDYRYMKMGYYVSLHADLIGSPVIPKCSDVLDVYRTPISLLRASKAGIPVAPYVVTDSAEEVISGFDLPVMIFAVNPFPSYGFQVAYSKTGLYGVMKRLTLNKRYTICAMPVIGELVSLKTIFGAPINMLTKNVCNGEVHRISKMIFNEFRVPMFKSYMQRKGDQLYLCGLDPLKNCSRLNATESALIADGITKVGEDLGQ
jgi:hypothetical protein